MDIDINEKIIEMGFSIDSFYEDKKCFGNIIIKSKLPCGVIMLIIRDRGIWECSIKDVPLVALFNLFNGISFDVNKVLFYSDEELIEWLSSSKQMLRILSKHDIKRARKKWIILNIGRKYKSVSINVLINIIGVIAIFVIFAFYPFLDWMIDKHEFLIPFWAWGIIGVVLFEIFYYIIIKRNSFNK